MNLSTISSFKVISPIIVDKSEIFERLNRLDPEEQFPTPWKTDLQKPTLLNTVANTLSVIGLQFAVCTGINSVWNGVFTLPSSYQIIPLIGMHYVFKYNGEAYKFYKAYKKYSDLRSNKEFSQSTKQIIRKELSGEIGQIWLKNNSILMDEGLNRLKKVCFEIGICDGDVLNFLNLVRYSNAASASDVELEDQLNYLTSIKYQVMRELKIDVRNKLVGRMGDPLVDKCDEYDPYTNFNTFKIYNREAGKWGLDKVFNEIWKKAEEFSECKTAVLVGRIAYESSQTVSGHVISVQFNLNHYRYRDEIIYSFQNLEELFKGLYVVSNNYFETYSVIEIRLWELPYADNLR